MMSELSLPDFSRRVESAALEPQMLAPQLHRIAADAMQNNLAAVWVAPVWLSRVVPMVRGSGVRVIASVGFPHGTSKATVKAIEASSALKDGADEVRITCHLPHLINMDLAAAKHELMEIVRAARAVRREAIITAIIESAVLLQLGGARAEDAIAGACRAVRESGCDGIVSSSGFHPAGGATAEAIGVMCRHRGELGVIAAGGINDTPVALALLNAGAEAIAVSDPVRLLEELRLPGDVERT